MRRAGICTVALVICVCFVLPSYAFFNSEVRKAKEFIKADMYPQAIELLNKRINDEPTDAEAHYLLGVCQFKTKSLRSADESFARAAKLDGDFKSKIAGSYKDLCGSDMRAYNLEAAEAHYAKMVEYAPSMKDPEVLKQIGYRYLKRAAETKGSMRESYKRRAASLVGQRLVDNVFQPSTLDTIWTKTFIASEADGKGRLKVIFWGKDDIRKGDVYEIEVELKPNVKINGPVFAHANYKKTFTAVNGLVLRRTVTRDNLIPGTHYEILLAMDVVDKVHLKVIRWSEPKIRMDLIDE